MKKLSILFLALFMALMAKAQVDETFQFVDPSGQVLPHNSIVDVITSIPDDFDGMKMIVPLSVKNMSDATAYVRVVYEITSIDNGGFQICFPVTCNLQRSVGTYETASGPMDGGQVKDLQSEWLPTTNGKCTVVLRLELMQLTGQFPKQSFDKLADGPQITVKFNNYATNGIAPVSTQSSVATAYRYMLDGRRLMSAQRGLNMVRMADGTVRKVFVR